MKETTKTTKTTKTAAKTTTKKTATPVAAQEKSFKRKVTGYVVSDKTPKTIVVKVDKKFMHPMYNKFVTRSKKFHVHDEDKKAKTGDLVVIIESRPHSKLKRWELLNIVK
jgi:small subunit ribosomal protein S17